MAAVNPYLKFIVAVLGAVVTSLSIYYSGARWFPILPSVVTALTVYFTPNIPNAPATLAPVVPVKDPANNPFGSGA